MKRDSWLWGPWGINAGLACVLGALCGVLAAADEPPASNAPSPAAEADGRPSRRVDTTPMDVAPAESAVPARVVFIPAAELRREEAGLHDGRQQRAMRRNAQRRVIDRYRYLLRRLTLTAEQRQALKALLVERLLSVDDAVLVLQRSGVTPDSAAYRAAIANTRADYDPALRSLLGDGFATFQDLDSVAPAMESMAVLLAGPAGVADLTDDQELRLAREWRDARGALTAAELRREPINAVTGLTPSTERLLGRSAAFLSATQRAALRERLMAQRRWLAAGQLPDGPTP